jgi:hypothetical protein
MLSGFDGGHVPHDGDEIVPSLNLHLQEGKSVFR